MSLVSLGSTSTFWTPISPLFGDSQTRSEAWRRNLDLVGGAGRGFSANDRITQTLQTAQRPCGPGCSSRASAQVSRIPNMRTFPANGSRFHAVVQTGGLL